MLIDHRAMRLLLASVLSVAAAGCTAPNPRNCADGACTDPTYPFCDVDGVFGGVKNECITVVCTAGELAGCRDDSEVRCNASGMNYDLTQCPLGCELASDGCKLCEPNQTACTNGQVVSCDAQGMATVEESCPLGCFDNEPRCRDIEPSNSLASFLDESNGAPDLDLDNVVIDTSTGELRDLGTNALRPAPFSTLIPPPIGGAAIRVFVANGVRLGRVEVTGEPALAIIANAEISVEGVVNLTNDRDLQMPGAVFFSSCMGGVGRQYYDAGYMQNVAGGNGGGGHATAGSKGGEVGPPSVMGQYARGGDGGGASGSDSLEPLRGGCAGGGAIQLSSRIRVRIGADGLINANGLPGALDTGGFTNTGGGGAGGGILIEAPEVTLEEAARLLANGGPGASAVAVAPTSMTNAVSIGPVCMSSSGLRCSNGGNGAGLDGASTAGGDVLYATISGYFQPGSGGAGLGYIRINTRTGSHTRASSSIESGVVTEGVLRTR